MIYEIPRLLNKAYDILRDFCNPIITSRSTCKTSTNPILLNSLVDSLTFNQPFLKQDEFRPIEIYETNLEKSHGPIYNKPKYEQIKSINLPLLNHILDTFEKSRK